MEPVTHILTGACLARTGLNRRAAYATLAMAVAAEFPDIDTLWDLRGPVEGFTHHRGITHTFLALPVEAAVLVAAVYGLHRWRTARAARAEAAHPTDSSHIRKPLTAAPVRWGLLYGFTLLALLSHLLLDYTNNYGLRPFYPFNPRWYAASIVFILDPWILALLVAALAVPLIFKLVSSEIGARRQPFRGRGWAVAALLSIVGWWTLRAVQHGKAVDLAMQQSILQLTPIPVKLEVLCSPNVDCDTPSDVPPHYLTAQRVLASPDPISPFHWSVATDFGPVQQLSEIDTRHQSIVPGQNTFAPPPESATLLIAEASPLGRAYLDWSPMPILSVSQPNNGLEAAASGDPDAAGLTVVTFRDPRFMGGWMRDNRRSALTATVSLDAKGRVVRQTLDGRTEPQR
jgi:inner membrane protein